jgi:hypothetical protein
MHQHQMYAQAVQQRDVMYQAGKSRIRNRFAAKGQHEGSPAMCVNIRRRLAEALNEADLPIFFSHDPVFRGLCL